MFSEREIGVECPECKTKYLLEVSTNYRESGES